MPPLPQEQNQQVTPLPQTAPQTSAPGGDDFLRPILDPVQADNSVKSQAWNAWHASKSSEDFQKAFEGINIPRETKSQLWNLRFKPSPEQLQQMLPAYARQYGVDPELMRRVIQQESGWKQYDPTGQPLTNAKSGAMGLTQLMPETAQRWGVDPRDPIANLQGGIQEFAQRYKESGGDLNKALAAYGGFVTKDPAQYTGAITHGYQPPPATKAAPAPAQPGQSQMPAMPGMFGQGPSQGLTPQQEQITVGQGIPDWMTGPLAGGQKYAVEPFNRMAQAGAASAGQEFKEAVSEFTNPQTGLSHPLAMVRRHFSPQWQQTPQEVAAAGQQHPIAMGVAGGVGEALGGMLADPRNWPFFLESSALEARPVLTKLISGGFGIQMGGSALQGLQQLYQNWDSLTPEQRWQIITSTGINTIFTGMAAHGALSPEGARPGPRTESAQPGVSMGQEPTRTQVVPQAAPSIAQEGGPAQVTQAGVTGAQEVTGGRVPAAASAPIEGAGRAAGTGAPDTGERRTGPQVSLPAGFERRGIKTPEQVQAEAQANLAAQDTAAEAKRQAYSQEERKRQAMLRIAQNPELSKAFRKAGPSEKEALLAHVAGLQIAALQPPPGGAVARPMRREIPGTQSGAQSGGPSAERTPGVPQAPTTTPTTTNLEPIRGSEAAARPAGESVQPGQAASRQSIRQPEQVAAGLPAYKPLPPEQRPFVPAGGGAPRFEQPKPAPTETSVRPVETTTAPALVPRGAEPEATARVQSEKAQGIERIRIDTRSGKEYPVARSVGMEDVQPGPYDRIIKRYPDGREEQVAEGAKARPVAGPTRPAKAAAGTVDQTLTRYLKKTEADEARVPGGRLDELGKAIGRERAKGPEQARSTAQAISDRGTRAQSYLDSINRIEKSADWEKEATDILHERIPKGEVDEQTGKFIVGRKWEGEEGVKGGTRTGGLDFSATFLREANPRRAEVLGNLLGLKQREVGKPTEWLEADPKEKLAGLQKQYQALIEQTRAEGGRPSDERLAQLEKLMEGIHALRGTRRIAVDEKGHPLGPEDMVGKTGEKIPAGSRASRAFLAELMGPRWSAKGHWARPTAEQFAARRAELENEIKWSKNTARALIEGLPGAEATPTEAPKPTAPEAPRPLKRLAGREVTGPAPKEFYKEIAKAAGLTYVGESSPGVHRFDDPARAGVTLEIPEKNIPETGAVKYLREQAAKFSEAPTPQKPGWGEKNTKYTKDKLQAAREKFKKAGETSYTGLDPELIKALTDIVGYHFEAGLRKFGDLAEQVVADLGEHVRPYLQDIYNQVRAQFEGPAKTPTERVPEPPAASKPAPSPETPKPTAEAAKTAPVAKPARKGGLYIAPGTERESLPGETPAKAPIKGAGVPTGRMAEAIRRELQKPHVERPKAEPERQEIVAQKREAVSPAAKARYEAESREQRTKFEQAKAAHQARLDEVKSLRAVDPQDYTPTYIERLAKFGRGLKDVEGKAEFLGKVEEARTGFSTGDDRAGHAAVTSALAMADQRLLEPRAGKLFAPEVKKLAPQAPARVSTRPEAPREPGVAQRVYNASAEGRKGLKEFTDDELRNAKGHVPAVTEKVIDAELAARGAEKGEIAKIAPETRPAVQAPKKETHVPISVAPPEGIGGKADNQREALYKIAQRIDALPRGEDRNSLATRVNKVSKEHAELSKAISWANRAIREMEESGQSVRTRTNKVTGEKRTETVDQLIRRVQTLGQKRTALVEEHWKPLEDTVSAYEKPALPGAPKGAETVQKPVTVMVHGHERVIDPNTGKLVEQLAPVIGEKKNVIPSPAPKEEGVPQRIEQLKQLSNHLANLYNKVAGRPTRSEAISINKLKKGVRALVKSIPKNLLPELPERVRAALEGGAMVEKALRAEYVSKPREGEVIEPREGTFRTGELQGNNAEDLNRWLAQNAEKGIPSAISEYIKNNFRKAGPAADLIAQHIMQAARAGKFGDIRGDEAPARAATRLYRALDALFQGRTKALSLPEGERASAKEQALQDSVDIARSGEKNPETLAQKRARLAREKPGERGFIGGRGQRGAGLEAGKRIREEREREEKGPFYNYSERVIREQWPTAGKPADPKAVAGTLANAGVSKNEMKWSDVDSFLLKAQKEGRQVTRKQVLDYLKEHNPKVEVTEKGKGPIKPEDPKIREAFNEAKTDEHNRFEAARAAIRNELKVSDSAAHSIVEAFADFGGETPEGKDEFIQHLAAKNANPIRPSLDEYEVIHKAVSDYFEAVEKSSELGDQLGDRYNERGPRYESYTLPGGENYREVLLRIPSEGRARLPVEDFRAPSSGEAHDFARELQEQYPNERYEIGPHREGGWTVYKQIREAYASPHFDEPNIVAHLRLKDRVDADGKKNLFIEEVQSDWDRELREKEKAQNPNWVRSYGAPDMPFTQGHWLELAMKHVLKEAAEKGYDKVAWTTGEQQADRYNLRKVADELQLHTYTDDYSVFAAMKNGKVIRSEKITEPGQLEALVGRANAEKLRQAPQMTEQAIRASGEMQARQSRSIGVKDFAMGGEHHLQLYDKMIPQFMEKYGKKWGAKVEEGSILTRKEGEERGPTSPDYERGKWVDKDQYDKVHTMAIPEGMRGVLKQPLRMIGGSQAGVLSFGGRKAKAGAEGAISRLFGKKANAQQSKGEGLMDRMRETSDAFKASRILDEGLEERRFQQQGMRQRFMQGLKDLPKVPGLQRALYKLAERSGKAGQFSEPEFQKVFDEHIRDWADLAEQRYLQLREAGHQVENYVPKYAIKKNTMWDRILRGKGQYTMGSALRQTASALKGRSFFRLEAPGIPSDTIVHEDASGNLTLWDNKKPSPLGLNREEMEAQGFKFGNALTDDITRHSGQDYLQHLYIATASKAMELDNAYRAHEFMEAYKESPEFKQYAVKAPPGAPVPDGFKYTRVPQLQGYAFEKHTADVLERYYDSLDHSSGNFLDKFNYGLMSTIYWNPLKHTKNIIDHWATNHGLSTFLDPRQAAPMARAFRKAWRAVIDGNADYLYGLDMGMPLRSRMVTGADMTEAILKEINPLQMRKNPETGQWEFTPEASALAKAWGKANPASLYKSYMRGQRRLLFGLDDVLRLQAVYHHQEMTGDTFKNSWKEVSKHLPDYTLPTHIGLRIPFTDIDKPSKALASAFGSRAMIFGRYHYGRLRSYGEMATDILSKGTPTRERWKSVDRLFVPAVAMTLYATLGKMAAQKLVKNKDAEMSPSGATAIPWMVMRLLQGKTSIGRTAMSTFTPNPLVDLAARMGYGELSRPKPLWEQTKEVVGLKGDLTQPSRLKLSGGLLGEIGPLREAEQTRKGIAGQIDWAEAARRAALNVYVPKESGGSRKGLPRLPHFPRTR